MDSLNALCIPILNIFFIKIIIFIVMKKDNNKLCISKLILINMKIGLVPKKEIGCYTSNFFFVRPFKIHP